MFTRIKHMLFILFKRKPYKDIIEKNTGILFAKNIIENEGTYGITTLKKIIDLSNDINQYDYPFIQGLVEEYNKSISNLNIHSFPFFLVELENKSTKEKVLKKQKHNTRRLARKYCRYLYINDSKKAYDYFIIHSDGTKEPYRK